MTSRVEQPEPVAKFFLQPGEQRDLTDRTPDVHILGSGTLRRKNAPSELGCPLKKGRSAQPACG